MANAIDQSRCLAKRFLYRAVDQGNLFETLRLIPLFTLQWQKELSCRMVENLTKKVLASIRLEAQTPYFAIDRVEGGVFFTCPTP